MGFAIYIFTVFVLYLAINASKIYKFLKKRLKIYKYVGQIDGPTAMPILGTTWQFKLDSKGFSLQLYNWAMEYCEKGAGLATFWIGPQPLIVVLNADAVKTVLESNKLIDKSDEYNVFLPWLGDGLLLSGGDRWRQRRKLLTPSFHFNVLQEFQQVFDFQSKVLIEKIEEEMKKQTTFDVFPFIKRCALDIICETAMGTTVDAQTNHNHPYVLAVAEMNKLAYEYQRKPWLWIPILAKVLGFTSRHKYNLDLVLDFTRKVIDEKQKEFEESGNIDDGKRKAFLDMLIEMKEEGGLNDEDIRSEVDTFMFEGHDTTSAGIGWTLWCLATHPEYQKKCHEELDSVFESINQECSTDDLKNLKYLDKCIKESLRMRPSVPQFAREVREDIVVDGKIIPEGCSIMVSPAFMHNNPRNYERFEEYDPERFSEDNISKRHAYAYIPFSAGPRNCIGQKFAMQEEKTVISWVLRRFEISTTTPFLDNMPLPETITRPEFGFPITFKLRT
ncbi:unnamed protein product [Caenorhabditis angaria]|uniref:CYtochrome P450 family n=1 Tax=Caenorhabditis angaria TaxID=860376 RepID=A0A9P1ICJ8_9PELO|nr:unnamed protein product [Caenorhabditis angaria]